MDTFAKYFNSALRFLSFRPRSEKEVRDFLLKKINVNYSSSERSESRSAQNSSSRQARTINNEDIVDKIITKLKDKNFINDEEFARMWIESRTRFKPRSFKLITLELKQKGISQEIINELVHSSEFVVQSDLEQAKTLVEKKLPKYKNLEKQELYQKLGSFLARRGFSWDTIKQAIDPDLIGVDETDEKGV